MYIGAGVWFFFILLFDCMLFFRYKYFQMAVAIVDAAADFFEATKRVILVSLFYGLVSLCFFAFVAISSVFIVGTSDVNVVYNCVTGTCHFQGG